MLMPKAAWIVVADGEKAMVLENVGTPVAPKLSVIARDEAGPVIGASDRAGRMADGGPNQRSALEQPDFARLNSERFVGDLIEMLDHKLRGAAFDTLILVAPPQMLGALRNAMEDTLRACVVAEIDKTLTNHPLPKITEIVAAEIALI
ncbi:MAG: host attachment family protein [Rhodobacteraceae bacterium]|jgi:protein required for attachment to host cells|nr:host attachment family protein [Paracoccaceae bacterium]